MNDYQFYPTPPALAERAWGLFVNKNFTRVLEPSAGAGDLMMHQCSRGRSGNFRSHVRWDAIEMNHEQHPLLRERGAKIVGHDFLAFKEGNIYSHIIMNPPFANGAQHLLHAWHILHSGEIVCILNAETIRNPYSKERKMLARIIETHGSVEFIQDAFKGDGVKRETAVEIALVHLTKENDTDEFIGNILNYLKKEQLQEFAQDTGLEGQLILPTGFVQDLVLRFNAAVLAAKDVARTTAHLDYYQRLLGETLTERNARDAPKNRSTSVSFRTSFATIYEDLKERAWSGLLRSTEVLSKLSSNAQKKVESEFETIKELEFSVDNVLGFLRGLNEASDEIRVSMALDVFDDIVRYHADNTVFYMGWKSNSKHRTAGMRIKTTRFVHPGHGIESWNKSLSYASRRKLEDFDRVFAMLDGKDVKNTHGLVKMFDEKFKELCAGERCASDYFDVRYYPKRGTIHFFPKSKDLVDRLNRLVGTRRQWLPSNMTEASSDFVKQYEQAEKFDKEVRETFTAMRTAVGDRNISYTLNMAATGNESGTAGVAAAIEKVLESKGIHPFTELCYNETLLLETTLKKETNDKTLLS